MDCGTAVKYRNCNTSYSHSHCVVKYSQGDEGTDTSYQDNAYGFVVWKFLDTVALCCQDDEDYCSNEAFNELEADA